jgi:hypothetical protein
VVVVYDVSGLGPADPHTRPIDPTWWNHSAPIGAREHFAAGQKATQAGPTWDAFRASNQLPGSVPVAVAPVTLAAPFLVM